MRKEWEAHGVSLAGRETRAKAISAALRAQAGGTILWDSNFATAGVQAKWQHDALDFNYGKGSGQELDAPNLQRNVVWEVSAGRVRINAIKENYGVPAKMNGSTVVRPATVAAYTAGSIQSIDECFAFGTILTFHDAVFELVNGKIPHRPVLWSTDDGSDGEFDNPEYFHTQERFHIGDITDYTPTTKRQIEATIAQWPAMFDGKPHNWGTDWGATDPNKIIYTFDGRVTHWTDTTKMPRNPHRVRISHQVGGYYDRPVTNVPQASMTVARVTVSKP